MNQSIKKDAATSAEVPATGMETAPKSPQNREKSPKMPKSPKNPSSKGKGKLGDNMKVETGYATFSDKIKNLPEPFNDMLSIYEKPKKKELLNQFHRLQDMVILTILTVLSSAMMKFSFYSRGTHYYPSLMSIIVALAGSGKSIIEPVFELISPIHKEFREKFKTMLNAFKEQQMKMKLMSKKELKEYLSEVIERPSQLFFRIPADSTYAAFMKSLAVMEGIGIILDTEIDTMLNAFKSEMGNYSVFLRKNFKHEHHSYSRKTEDEYYEINNPRFSVVLSGTLSQMENFLNEVLSGLYSRFCIYWNPLLPEWEDEKYYEEEPMDEKKHYLKFGEHVTRLYHVLARRENDVKFRITEKQLKKFNKNFANLHANYVALDGGDISATIFRMSVICRRIAMIFSMSRLLYLSEEEMEKALESGVIECSDTDFDNAMIISLVLTEHASAYFEHITGINDEAEIDLTESNDFHLNDERLNNAVNALPNNKEMTTKEIIDIFISKNIPESTASKSIRRLCKKYILKKIKYGIYIKSSVQEYLMKSKDKAKSKKNAKNKAVHK